MEKVLFYTGTQEEYDALDKKSSALYFCDNGIIYKGDQVFSSMQLLNEALEKISYNSDIRVINLPYYNEANQLDTLTIDLGKDLIIKTAYYDANTKEIVLVFETMMAGDLEEKELRISVNDLVDTYIGSINSSMEITVVNKAIIGRVRIHEQAENEKPNYLTIQGDGLYVDVETYVDKSVGNLSIKDITYADATSAVSQVQSNLDITNNTVSKIREDVDKKTPLTRVITSTGKTLEQDIELSYEDIDGSAPIDSPIFTGQAKVPDVSRNIDWTIKDNENIIATVKFVKESIVYSKTWGGVKRQTWKQLKGSST